MSCTWHSSQKEENTTEQDDRNKTGHVNREYCFSSAGKLYGLIENDAVSPAFKISHSSAKAKLKRFLFHFGYQSVTQRTRSSEEKLLFTIVNHSHQIPKTYKLSCQSTPNFSLFRPLPNNHN